MSHTLQDKAMLVNLSISGWTASKQDKTAGKAVKAQSGAAEKAGWFNKRLIDPAALQPINKIEGAARDTHYKFTLPWGDNGDRILPAQAFFDYTQAIGAFRSQHESAVNQFVKDYPALVQSARVMLGAMYDPKDYPEPHMIAQRFGMRTVFTPVPDAKDFRVDVGDEAVAEIRKSITESVDARLAGATRECWSRLGEAVDRMVETLSDPTKVFRDTLVENLRTLCEILPKLNIVKDMNLDIVIDNVRVDLLINPDALRKDPGLRQYVCGKAYDISLEIKSWTISSPTA